MRTTAIVQARMGSSRLPGKVLADVGGKPVLARIIERLRRCETLDEIVIATSTETRDRAICELAEAEQVPFFCGSESDVLSRFVGVAKKHPADIYVRITADCPLVDPGIVDRTVRALRMSKYDFASNAVVRTFPVGLDVEACWSDVLFRLDRIGTTPQEREHVFWGAYMVHPHLFLTRLVKDEQNNADLRWTLDTALDLEHIRSIYDDVDYRTLIERCRERRAA